MGIRKKCLIITLLCFSSLMHASEFMFKHLEVKDGLSNNQVWGIERSGFFNGREKWAKGFENQRV